ncbi:hypothetical protein B0H67DRAFT_613841 [Lasiosphaeris hirsuta]|uniref:Uncharacterized protein n=1 Tax=Lasiosphaeris hirsuta TaxID=260670 RepID=A0AA40DLR7_9PEZI|nr:hypothetical protein B0H67DRAFT_613841 [Lasiosphaeris hirsuta]
MTDILASGGQIPIILTAEHDERSPGPVNGGGSSPRVICAASVHSLNWYSGNGLLDNSPNPLSQLDLETSLNSQLHQASSISYQASTTSSASKPAKAKEVQPHPRPPKNPSPQVHIPKHLPTTSSRNTECRLSTITMNNLKSPQTFFRPSAELKKQSDRAEQAPLLGNPDKPSAKLIKKRKLRTKEPEDLKDPRQHTIPKRKTAAEGKRQVWDAFCEGVVKSTAAIPRFL